jgi:ribosomal protein S17E
MARKKSTKTTAKQLAEDLKTEVTDFTDENKKINEDMIGATLDELKPSDPPKITLV